jgi:hypothetical protein
MSTITGFNPMSTTNAAGGFRTQSDGYTQGVAHDDPAARYALAGGYLAATETLPMYGGVAISETVSSTIANGHMGNAISRATLVANVTGFSVFNQSHNGINWPQSRVPTIQSNMSVNFYRLGSGARIPVACDPGLVSANGQLITQQVSWDFNNQRLQAYVASAATVSVTSMTATYSATLGGETVAIVCAAASDVQAVGDAINISGATNAGTGGNSVVNGNFIVTDFTDNQNFSIFIPTANTGVITTIAGTIVLNQGIGALPVQVLNVAVGNSRTVVWDPVNLTANWNNAGAVALILI